MIKLGGMGPFLRSLAPHGFSRRRRSLRWRLLLASSIEEPVDHQIHVASQQAEKELGIEYKWLEKVQTADFGRVMREYDGWL